MKYQKKSFSIQAYKIQMDICMYVGLSRELLLDEVSSQSVLYLNV